MITRIWHGRTNLQDAESYLQFLLTDDTKEYLKIKGNLSVKVWQQREKDYCHFWTVSEWTDIEAVKGFAGEDYEKSKYYPQDNGFLLEFEEKVSHYPPGLFTKQNAGQRFYTSTICEATTWLFSVSIIITLYTGAPS